MWALPARERPWILTYDVAAFDREKLAYPTDKWTIDDLTNAMNKLTVHDTSGAVTTPALAFRDDNAKMMLFRSLIGENLFDSATLPNAPRLDTPAAEAFLDAWSKLDQQGMIGGNYVTAPMGIAIWSNAIDTQSKRAGVLLPGGKGGLEIGSFALSAGTQSPEQAYALAKFLSSRLEVAFGTYLPARKSLLGNKLTGVSVPDSLTKLTQSSLDNAIPIADMRYADYLRTALNLMKTQKANVKQALQTVEMQAVNDVQVAANKKNTLTLSVATPIPNVALAPGKIDLKFEVSSTTLPLPNLDRWTKLSADFSASDPQVGKITLITNNQNLSAATANSDCFYLPDNQVPAATLSQILNVDPFTEADKSFDKTDMVGNVLADVQRDNKTWAVPLTVQPQILQINTDQFKKAGLPIPAANWTTAEFLDALKALKPDKADPSPFVTTNRDGTYVMALIAGFGGLPIDYRTTPPTINMTDPATVTAIRQVLDLAKKGYIKYTPMGVLIGAMPPPDRTATIYPDILGALRVVSLSSAGTYKPVLYPKGSQYVGVGYTLGTAYISAHAQSADACYRWISTLAQHPELFATMPARRSQFKNPALQAVVGVDMLAIYAQVDTALKDGSGVPLSTVNLSGAAIDFLGRYWLYQVFDNYVLKDADLDTELKNAQSFVQGFQDCSANLPPLDPNGPNTNASIQPYIQCAIKIDPRLKPLLGGLG